MQVIVDLLYGAVIAGVVLLLVLSMKLRGEQTSVDAAQFRAAKIGTLSLVETLERDFTNIGSQRRDLTLTPEDSFVGWDTSGVPAYLVFMTQTDSQEVAQPVCYAWREMPGKTVELKRGTVPLIHLERRIGAGPTCTGGTLAGMNTNMLTRFEVHLLPDSSDAPITINLRGSNANVRRLLVRLRTVSPLGPGEAIEESRWERMFRPPNLWKPREI